MLLNPVQSETVRLGNTFSNVAWRENAALTPCASHGVPLGGECSHAKSQTRKRGLLRGERTEQNASGFSDDDRPGACSCTHARALPRVIPTPAPPAIPPIYRLFGPMASRLAALLVCSFPFRTVWLADGRQSGSYTDALSSRGRSRASTLSFVPHLLIR